jgi:hypothetical protein
VLMSLPHFKSSTFEYAYRWVLHEPTPPFHIVGHTDLFTFRSSTGYPTYIRGFTIDHNDTVFVSASHGDSATDFFDFSLASIMARMHHYFPETSKAGDTSVDKLETFASFLLRGWASRGTFVEVDSSDPAGWGSEAGALEEVEADVANNQRVFVGRTSGLQHMKNWRGVVIASPSVAKFRGGTHRLGRGFVRALDRSALCAVKRPPPGDDGSATPLIPQSLIASSDPTTSIQGSPPSAASNVSAPSALPAMRFRDVVECALNGTSTIDVLSIGATAVGTGGFEQLNHRYGFFPPGRTHNLNSTAPPLTAAALSFRIVTVAIAQALPIPCGDATLLAEGFRLVGFLPPRCAPPAPSASRGVASMHYGTVCPSRGETAQGDGDGAPQLCSDAVYVNVTWMAHPPYGVLGHLPYLVTHECLE